MRRFKYSYLVLLVIFLASCQTNDFPGEGGVFMRFYGSDATDLGGSILELSDGGFAICGSQTVEGQGEDMLLLRVDADGYLLWRKTFGGVGTDKAEHMVEMPDGGFVLVGHKAIGSNGGNDVFLVRTDAAGNQLWANEYGGGSNDFGQAIKVTPDGGFAIAGYTSSFGVGASISNPNFMLLKVDASGNEQWLKAHGGLGDEKATAMLLSSDGGFILSGYSNSYASLNYEAQVMKLDANGDSVWTYHGISNFHDEGRGIAIVNDSTYAWLGFTFRNNNDFDIVLQWVNDRGEEVPDRTWIFGGNDNDRALAYQFVIQEDGAPIIAGHTQSYGHGANDIYLLKGNTQPGQEVWQQFYGGSNEDIPTGVIKTSDGGYAIIGHSKSFNVTDDYDIFFIKTDGNGEMKDLAN